MSSALARAKSEVEVAKSKARISTKKAKEKAKMETIFVVAAGGAGTVASSAGCAVVDGKWAKDGKSMATFGESNIPMVPVVGLMTTLAGIGLSFVHKPTGAFFGFGGLNALNIGLYNGVKDKVIKGRDEDEDE
jgi:hypothetical protein